MIAYKEGYKYVLVDTYTYETGIIGFSVDVDFLAISNLGTLTIRRGYAWDGPSGPTIDTPNFMRGSLVHDALYQLMREDQLPRSLRKKADDILLILCKQDGMSWLRRKIVSAGVAIGGERALELHNPVLFAPEKQ